MRISKVVLFTVALSSGFTSVALASGDLVDSRLNSVQLDNRIKASRLSLPPVKDKDKKEELQVKRKRKVSSARSSARVTRFKGQRKRKTKRVVAAQD